MLPVLLAVSLNRTEIALAVALVFCGISAFGWLYRKDSKVEQRRLKVIKTCSELRKRGFDILPDIGEHYAVGDYDGVLERLTSNFDLLTNTEMADSVFNRFFEKNLTYRLGQSDEVRRIKRIVDAAATLLPTA